MPLREEDRFILQCLLDGISCKTSLASATLTACSEAWMLSSIPLSGMLREIVSLREELSMFSGIVAMAVIAVLTVLFVYALHRLVSVRSSPLTVLPFQSGFMPQEHALSRYHVRWYLASLVFLAFDVEMLFMYPWAIVVIEKGFSAVVEMFLFLGALLIAVAWARREGAFRWA